MEGIGGGNTVSSVFSIIRYFFSLPKEQVISTKADFSSFAFSATLSLVCWIFVYTPYASSSGSKDGQRILIFKRTDNYGKTTD